MISTGPLESSPPPKGNDRTFRAQQRAQADSHPARLSTPTPKDASCTHQDQPPAGLIVNVPHSRACPAQNERLRSEALWTSLPTRHVLLRKEVIQPHLPVRLPCYDLVLITDPTLDSSLPQGVRPLALGVTDFHDLTGGVYKARERIHRSVADLRLLATPTSWGRVADPNPN